MFPPELFTNMYYLVRIHITRGSNNLVYDNPIKMYLRTMIEHVSPRNQSDFSIHGWQTDLQYKDLLKFNSKIDG